MRQEYRVKEKKDEPQPMQVDSEKAPATDVVQAKDGKDKNQDAQKGPMIVEKSVDSSVDAHYRPFPAVNLIRKS